MNTPDHNTVATVELKPETERPRNFIERVCDRIFGPYALQEIDGAWILEANADIDLWFNLDDWGGWFPELTFKKEGGQEDIDFRWGWVWLGYTRRYKGWQPKRVENGKVGEQ